MWCLWSSIRWRYAKGVDHAHACLLVLVFSFIDLSDVLIRLGACVSGFRLGSCEEERGKKRKRASRVESSRVVCSRIESRVVYGVNRHRLDTLCS